MCSIITNYTNPQLTVFADETKTNKKMKSGLYSKHSYNIIIMNPPHMLRTNTNNVLANFEKYIGIISEYKCLHFRKEDCGGIYISFKYWYDNHFTQALHRELVISHKISNSYTDNHIKINIDGYVYELILCQMKFC